MNTFQQDSNTVIQYDKHEFKHDGRTQQNGIAIFDDFLTIIPKNGLEMYAHMFRE